MTVQVLIDLLMKVKGEDIPVVTDYDGGVKQFYRIRHGGLFRESRRRRMCLD
jgi:hypothetical protein